MDQVKITLKKSLIGRKPQHIKMAHQLGLRKINRTVTHTKNCAIMGIVNKIEYLLHVEESSS